MVHVMSLFVLSDSSKQISEGKVSATGLAHSLSPPATLEDREVILCLVLVHAESYCCMHFAQSPLHQQRTISLTGEGDKFGCIDDTRL
jgi:hypothetical protein